MQTSCPLPEDYRPGTLVELFLDGLSRPKTDAARTRLPDGTWTSISSDEIGRRVRGIALALRSEGLQRGDRVAILSHTRLEWALADWGIIMAGLVSVPVYPVLPAEQVQYALADSRASAVFVEGREQLDKIAEIAGELPELRLAIAFEGAHDPGETPRTLGLDAIIAAAGDVEPALADTYESHARETRPEELAMLIYTSGTTGDPKGVMLTHANVHSNATLTLDVFPLGPEDVALAMLPLAHVFERTIGHFIMWVARVTVAYAESTHTVGRDLREVSPTVMAAVPRVFEKVLERIEETAREAGGTKTRIFAWARQVGELRAKREMAGERQSPVLSLQAALADRLVFSKLRERVGGRVRYFASGGAPLSADVALFFAAAEIPVIEGYGLTETSPLLTFNPVEAIRIGTVGRAIPGTELRIAEDGEILARGPQIMAGYHNRAEATAEAIDADGWFHTGDVGEIDADGYLKITDRKKDLIITAYGKNIAPQRIEAEIKRHPLIAEAVVLGDRQKFPIVIVVPEFTALRGALHGVTEAADADLLSDRDAVELLQQAVKSATAEFAHYEQPREILPVLGPFTIEGGELTPKLSVKRRVIEARYAGQIDALYERAENALTEEQKESGGA